MTLALENTYHNTSGTINGFQTLVESAIKGDYAAQKAIFEKISPLMFTICRRYAQNDDDAKDILQEGFIKGFSRISQWKADSNLQSWFARIMVNTALDVYRKQIRTSMSSIDDHLYNLSSVEDDPEVSQRDDYGRLEFALECMQKLPAGYRAVINLYAIEGLSHKEIAEKLGINEVTSRTQLLKARNMLKKIMIESETE